jgi:hypothetical protein
VVQPAAYCATGAEKRGGVVVGGKNAAKDRSRRWIAVSECRVELGVYVNKKVVREEWCCFWLTGKRAFGSTFVFSCRVGGGFTILVVWSEDI